VLSNVDGAQRYFTIMMVSRHLQAEHWFRVLFQRRIERDALVIDIPISSLEGESTHLKKMLKILHNTSRVIAGT
jgi:hypothetical protein